MSVAIRTVSEDEAEIRLDRWFRRHFPALTQGVIEKLCRTGQVRVDGRRADAATRLAPGQAVRVPPLPASPPPPPRATPPDAATERDLERMMLWRDDQLIVLDKPHGLPTQGGPGIARHLDGMLDGLRLGYAERPRLVHRLDRETSGVVIAARTKPAAAFLSAAFAAQEVEKTYLALVCGGAPAPAAGAIEAALARAPGRIDLDLVRTGRRTDRVAPAGREDAGAARAITDYRTLDHAGSKLTWLELSPLTGRTHQLRVHCAALGTPILGDLKYGTERLSRNAAAEGAMVAGLSSQLHLHARRLVLPHPAGGMLEVEAGLPLHMRETFWMLGFSAPAVRAPRRC